MVHADFVHGAVADQARNCLVQHGAYQLFYETKTKSIHFLTRDRFQVYDVVKRKIDGEWTEVTAFAPKCGNPQAVKAWLSRKPGKFISSVAQAESTCLCEAKVAVKR